MSWKSPLPPMPEVIGFCPGCSKSIREGQQTKLVLGQLFHAEHAPRPSEK
jgi:hypothetical protein